MRTFSKNNGKNFQRTSARNFLENSQKKKKKKKNVKESNKKKNIPRTGYLEKNFEDIPTKTSF